MSNNKIIEHFDIDWQCDFWGRDSGWVCYSKGDIEIVFSHITSVEPHTIDLVRLDVKTETVITWFGLSSEEQTRTEFVPVEKETFYITSLSCGNKLYLKEDLLEGLNK